MNQLSDSASFAENKIDDVTRMPLFHTSTRSYY
jgi:hypothetical protein